MFKIRKKLYSLMMKGDPAPTRFVYLFNRFWLRRSFRFTVLTTLPLLTLLVSLIFVCREYDVNIFMKKIPDRFSEILLISPMFRVLGLTIVSDDPLVIEKVKTKLDMQFPLSSLSINVGDLRKQIENVKLVSSASVRLTSDGYIEVVIEPRKPIVVHRVGGKLFLLDSTGFEVDQILSRSQRLDLPLLVGPGAEQRVDEALRILLEAKSLISRVRGLIRIGERRWDVVLDGNQLIKLPENDPIGAMKKVYSLQEGRKLLDRDILYLDFRDVARPVLGLTDEISDQLREIRNLTRGDDV